MHLAYLDDSGTTEHSQFVMFGAVIIPHGMFGSVENLHCAAIQQFFSRDEIEDRFQEFHSSALFNGAEPFNDIPQEKRFDAIRVLLTAVQVEGLPYIYAAVDRKKLKESPVATADARDMAFRLCVLGVEEWARSMHPQRNGTIQLDFKDLCLFVVDDTTDNALKKQLRSSYRALRVAHPYIPPHKHRLWHAHDDLYFGDSRESIGIQMADVCNYFMWRHLVQKEGGEEFYDAFVGQAIAAKPEPEWSMYRGLFVAHDGSHRKLASEPPNDATAKSKSAQ